MAFAYLSSGDASDSICPKGWGMGGTSGDGSYEKLVRVAYGENIRSIVQSYREHNVEIKPDEIMLQLLMSFNHTGYYSRTDGKLGGRKTEGESWQKSNSSISAYTLYFAYKYLITQDLNNKGSGYSVRRVAKAFLIFSSQLSSGDASDSICPKGWGMVGNSGDGSYEKLIVNVYGINKTNTDLKINEFIEYQKNINSDESIVQLLFSFLHSGDYYYLSGSRNGYNIYGYSWENLAHSTQQALYLSFRSNYIYLKVNNDKGNGRSLRCVAKSCFSPNFLPIMLLTLSAPKGGE